MALLKVLLAAKSEAHNVAPRLLANSEDLDRLATEAAPDVPRAVADYIAGMTDRFAAREHERLTGQRLLA